MELLKLLNASEIVAQAICFLLALAILRVFLWKRFLKILDDRREKVASDLRNIEAMKTEAAGLRADYAARLSAIEEEARQKIREAVAEGRKLTEEMRLKADVEGEKILQNARDSIRAELAKAKDELKDNIVDLSIAAAERVIQERLTEESDRRIVEDFLKGIER